MIPDVDNALRELLLQDLPLRKGEVEITFDLPKRQWSSQLNKPAINLYLFDIKQNLEYRGSEILAREKNQDGTVTIRRNPVRMDLFYLITCWTREVQDEHRLLSAALIALLRRPYLPDELVPESLKNQSFPIRLDAAQGNAINNVTDLWNSLDNELHPGIRLTVTLSIDPYTPEIVKWVETTELRFVQTAPKEEIHIEQEQPPKNTPAPSKTYFMINGRVLSQKFSPAVLRLVVTDTGQEICPNPQGEFLITGLHEGEYTIDVFANDRILKQQKFLVPSSNYEIRI